MFDVKVLSEPDRSLILDFENERLKELNLSDIEREMKSWDQPWREESLDHYIKLGWSFVARVEGRVVGYTLCQPLLFFKNYTQSLWIEYTSFEEESCGSHLIDTACRWAKSKHLQKVFIKPEARPAAAKCHGSPPSRSFCWQSGYAPAGSKIPRAAFRFARSAHR